MKTLNLFLIFFFLFSINSYSVTKCEGADPIKWDNCNGTTLLPDIKWEKGRKYIGEFQNGKPNGEGTAIWLSDPDGNKYEGKWKNGKRHGKGTQMYNGFRLVSTWVNDVNKGKGILFFPESDQKYKSLEGYFNQNGVIKGKAVITYADDSKINLIGNLYGNINNGPMPIIGWKNYWYGKYKIINYLHENIENKVKLLNAAIDGCFIEASLKPGLVRHRLKNEENWISI